MVALRIGYLHLGAAAHGVRRYGALLAAAARRREDIEITEAEAVLTGQPRRDEALLTEAGRRLSTADVVHLQFQPNIWGGRRDRLRNLRNFMRHCEAPLVATLHDVYPYRGGRTSLPRLLFSLKRRMPRFRHSAPQQNAGQPDQRIAAAAARAAARVMVPSSYAAVRWLLHNVHTVLVSHREEEHRLSLATRATLGVIPHFVEERVLDVDPVEARSALGLENNATLTVLGFIHPRKGHHLVVEALAQLEPEVRVVFAGSAATGQAAYVRDLLALAESLGVRERVRVTGYLPEEMLNRYLAATDLAVCPFLTCSASGSLSTWISAGRPTIASDLPQIAEYNALEPGAIAVFRPLAASALAKAIHERLAVCKSPDNSAISRLARRLAISTILEEHLQWYWPAAGAGSQTTLNS